MFNDVELEGTIVSSKFTMTTERNFKDRSYQQCGASPPANM